MTYSHNLFRQAITLQVTISKSNNIVSQHIQIYIGSTHPCPLYLSHLSHNYSTQNALNYQLIFPCIGIYNLEHYAHHFQPVGFGYFVSISNSLDI